MLWIGIFAAIGGILFAALPVVVQNDIIAQVGAMLSKAVASAPGAVAKTGVGILKILVRGTIAGTIVASSYTVLDMVADQRLQLAPREVEVLKEYWALINEAGVRSNTDPYMLAAVWRVENSLKPVGPSNEQGIGGFYSAVQSGQRFPVGEMSDGEILRQLILIGEILHSKCRGVDITYETGFRYQSENYMWERAECFATYNGSQGSLVRGVYSSNGYVFNNMPTKSETHGLTVCLTDGCTIIGPMGHDGAETSYRKIKAHVVSNPQLGKGVVTDPLLAVGRVWQKLFGSVQRIAMALEAEQLAWIGQGVIQNVRIRVSGQQDQFAWPAPPNTRVSFGYGKDPDYIWDDSHNGIDIVAPELQVFTVTSASTGKVTYAQEMDDCNLGVVKIQTGDLEMRYAHLDPETLSVAIGQEVSTGQVLGRLYGSATTCSDGPHLHFMVLKDGLTEDPQEYLPPR